MLSAGEAVLASRLQTGVEQVVQAERNEQRIVAEERSAARSGRHFRVLGLQSEGVTQARVCITKIAAMHAIQLKYGAIYIINSADQSAAYYAYTLG